ncbi:PQQ-binding-like beta-propeller repeat protein [Alteraurantiacibacter aquimixticola]|nr:PQQ-binding-like beta-propeller repeat protein [Alteraurantiacibacter aquimixticola]
MRMMSKLALGGALASLALAQASGQSIQGSSGSFTPVTDTEVQNPDPADWLSWRRTLDSWGYSPLDQITRENVADLRMVWVRPLPPGHQEGTPLVHDGVMYFPGPADVIEAIDAKSGQLIWQYRRQLPEDIGDYLPVYDTNRNIAIYGNLIIAASADDYIYALDARTGEVAWETKILDYRHGAKQSSGPIIAEGLAITGRSCEPEGGPEACVITAHNALTGEEVWRTPTIAQGSDPNDATWGDVPLEDRQQVGAWMIASYDPELRLVYMGTSVTAPAPKIALAGPEHTYLYHNSTLALDVETGAIRWHYQHMVDNWDIDHPFPRMLVDTAQAPDPAEVSWINPDIEPGRTYKVLTGVPGKTGVIYTLDRETGEFLWARPTIEQNLVGDIDGATGRVTLNPETVPTEYGKALYICPSPAGGTNYPAGAFSPLTGIMYLTSTNTCSEVTALDPATNPGVYAMSNRQHIAPGAEDNVGVIHAVSAENGRTAWEWSTRAGMQSLMTTGGGLLFAGDAGGYFRAMDQLSGEILWQVNLGSSVTGYPATFMVDGQQYVAASTGRWLNDTFTPELTHGAQNTLFVFALPQAGIGHAGPYRAPVNPAGRAIAVDPAQNNGQGASFSRKVGDGVYSAAQARAGEALYRQRCAACHGTDFQPAPGSPTLRGGAFLTNWRGRSVGDLFAYTRDNMPVGQGGSLSDAQYLSLVAYMLEINGYPHGEELDPDEAMLAAIGFE